MGRLWRQPNDLDALADENPAKCIALFRIPIKNQVSLSAQEAVIQVSKVACDLRHPPAVGMGRDACYLHGAAGNVDDK
jgi:hypothetical protein